MNIIIFKNVIVIICTYSQINCVTIKNNNNNNCLGVYYFI